MTWVLAPIAAALWVLAANRLRSAPASAAQRLMTATVTSFALTVTLKVPLVRHGVTAVGGQPADIVSDHLATMSVQVLILLFVREISGRGLTRRTITVLATLTLTCTTGLLLVMGPTYEAMTYSSSALTYPWAWPWVCYWSLTIVFGLWAFGTGAAFYWRYSRRVQPQGEALGVVLIAVGTSIALLVTVLRACIVISAPLEGMRIWEGWALPTALAAVTVLLMVVVAGLASKTVTTWPARRRTWRGQRESVSALEPLWKDLTSAIPNITLDHRALAPLAGIYSSQRDKLYRRMIEINDGLLALTSYTSAPLWRQAMDQALATGEAPGRARVVADAVTLRLALRNYRDRSPVVQASTHLVTEQSGDFSTEVDRLSDLATTTARCPLTARITERLLEMETT